MKEYLHKVPGGKLIRVKIEVENGKIWKFQLLGDFFLYPEEKISLIEKALIGKRKEEVLPAIACAVRKGKIKLIGISAEDIENTVQKGFEQ